MGQINSTFANTPDCYSPTGMFDILILTINNWIMQGRRQGGFTVAQKPPPRPLKSMLTYVDKP